MLPFRFNSTSHNHRKTLTEAENGVFRPIEQGQPMYFFSTLRYSIHIDRIGHKCGGTVSITNVGPWPA